MLARLRRPLFEEEADRLLEPEPLRQPFEVGDVLERTRIVRTGWAGDQELHTPTEVADTGGGLDGPFEVLSFRDPDWRQQHDVGAEQAEAVIELGGARTELEQRTRVDTVGDDVGCVKRGARQLVPLLQSLRRDEDRRDARMLAAEQIPGLALVHPGPVERVQPADVVYPGDDARAMAVGQPPQLRGEALDDLRPQRREFRRNVAAVEGLADRAHRGLAGVQLRDDGELRRVRLGQRTATAAQDSHTVAAGREAHGLLVQDGFDATNDRRAR